MLDYNSIWNIDDLLLRQCKAFPHKEAIVDEQSRLTYEQLNNQSMKLAAYFQQQLHIQKGDRIAIAIPNSVEYVVAFYASIKIGAVVIPMNPNYQKEELQYIITTTEPKVVITDDVTKINEIKTENNLSYDIFTVADQAGTNTLAEIMKNDYEIDKVDITKDDLAVIMFTSGTTGKPKGAMLTHGNILYTGRAGAVAMQSTEKDNYLIPNPLFHIMGITFMVRSLWTAAKIVLMGKYSVREALRTIEKERITVHPGVPTMFVLELNSEYFDQYDLSSLRTGEIAAAPCPVEVVKAIRDKMNCNVLVAYGATETSATLTVTSFEDSNELRSQTVGRAIPGVDIKVVNEHGKICKIDEVGELLCRGPGVMKGYYKMPAETDEAFDEYAYFKTGDMATIDKNGYVRIVGRKKEMIIRGGFNIYPREIEEILHEHPKIKEAAIVGMPDELFGEIPIACVSLKADWENAEEEIIEYLQARLVKYKIPDKVVVFENLPVTASGKISKLKIKDELSELASSN